MAGLGYFRHDKPSVGTGRIAPDMQKEVLWSPDGVMYILWISYQTGYVLTCGKLSFGTGPALAMSSIMVYPIDEYTPGLYLSYTVGSFGASYGEGRKSGEMLASLNSYPRHVACSSQGHYVRVLMDVLLFSQCGTPLVHRYCVFGGGGAHVFLRGNFMSRMRAFTVEADADGRLAWKRTWNDRL